jgi:hypothetical protein
MIEIKADTTALQEAMAEYHSEFRKSMPELMRAQGAILVAHMIALTPPARRTGANMNDTGGVSLDAKKRGEAVIAADIAKVFPVTKLKPAAVREAINAGFEWRIGNSHKAVVRDYAETLEHAKSAHRYSRNPKSGRTRKIGGIGMAITTRPVLRQLIKDAQRRVGLLAAGWLTAGRELKTAARNMPAWIKRHGEKPGGAQRTGDGIRSTVRIFNRQSWFPGNMDARTQLALDRRAKGLRKEMAALIERRTAKANAKLGGS